MSTAIPFQTPDTSKRPRGSIGVARSPRVEVRGEIRSGWDRVLSPLALRFVAELAERFAPAVGDLLEARGDLQRILEGGARPDFRASSAEVLHPGWRVGSCPADLLDRRVELRTSADRISIARGLRSGTDVLVADLEDSTPNDWRSIVEAHLLLLLVAGGRLRVPGAPGSGTSAPGRPALILRPRGLHQVEESVTLRDRPVPASLFDFGLYVYHSARALLARGSGPYLQLPKLRSPAEVLLWNAVFDHAEESLRLPPGSIRACLSLGSVPAAFELEEMLHVIRNRSIGVAADPWDYVFSHVSAFGHDPAFLLPDRDRISMEQPFLWAFARRLVDVCHARGAHAIGPLHVLLVRGEPRARESSARRILADKAREVHDGFDGTAIADPGLVPIVRDLFGLYMSPPHQIHRHRAPTAFASWDLIEPPRGPRTPSGLRANVRAILHYLDARLRNRGCAAVERFENASTISLSRAQIWQWLRHEAPLEGGAAVTLPLVEQVVAREILALRTGASSRAFAADRLRKARLILHQWIRAGHCPETPRIP